MPARPPPSPGISDWRLTPTDIAVTVLAAIVVGVVVGLMAALIRANGG